MIGKKYVHDNKNMWYIYFFYLIFALYVFFLIYAKVHSPFWFQQPVLHVYELYPIIRRIITNKPYYKYYIKPRYDSYCNHNIYTFNFNEINKSLKNKIIKLLQGHYYDNEYTLFHLNNDLLSEITTKNSFISCLFEKKLKEIDNTFINSYDPNILGMISSRQTSIFFKDHSDMNNSIHYIDFLCLNDAHKDAKNYRSLVKTHIYNHSNIESNHMYSYIIKKEVELCKDVVPLCKYDTFTFIIQKTPITNLPYNYYIRQLDSTQVETWKTIFYQLTQTFSVSILPSFENTINWLTNERYLIYTLSYKTDSLNLLGIYIFEKTHISMEKIDNKNELLRLSASMIFDRWHLSYVDLFFKGFLHCTKQIFLDNKKIGVLEIPNISMNNIILTKWQEKYTFHNNTETALYSYNLIVPNSPINSNTFLCLT